MVLSRSLLAAAAGAFLCGGHQAAAFDDQSSLVQRFAEEPQLSSAGKPKPILEVAFDPPGAYTDIENQIMQKAAEKTKKIADHAVKVAQETQVKVAKGQKRIKKAIAQRTAEAGEQLHAAKKLAKSKMRPLWRKEKDSTDYGILDSIVEKTRAKVNSKVAEKSADIFVKSQDLQNRFSDSVIQKVPQNMMPMMAPMMAPVMQKAGGMMPGAEAAPAGDDEWSKAMAGPPMTDMEIAAAVAKYREAEEKAQKEKREKREANRKKRQAIKEANEQINEEDFADGVE